MISSVGADGQSGGFDSSNYTLNPISSSAKGRVRLDNLLTWKGLFLVTKTKISPPAMRFIQCSGAHIS